MSARWFDSLSFRIGTSSYIIPDDILPNVRWLSTQVRDIELVLFDVDQYCNIPTEAQCAELTGIAAQCGFSYTVHLPLDLNFSADERGDLSIQKAQKVIRATRSLEPFAYVCHLACAGIDASLSQEQIRIWQDQRVQTVNRLLSSSPIQSPLAIENLESYPIEWNEPVITSCKTQACLDIGHLWLQQRDVLPLLESWLSRTRVIHLHGIGSRDHQSLAHMPFPEIRQLMQCLIRYGYRGVLTLEVFNQADFETSMAILEKACREVCENESRN